MKLSAPKMVTFLICLVAFVVGLLAVQGIIGGIGFGIYLVYGAFVLLAISCLLKGI